jgi:hypothetical protein
MSYSSGRELQPHYAAQLAALAHGSQDWRDASLWLLRRSAVDGTPTPAHQPRNSSAAR